MFPHDIFEAWSRNLGPHYDFWSCIIEGMNGFSIKFHSSWQVNLISTSTPFQLFDQASCPRLSPNLVYNFSSSIIQDACWPESLLHLRGTSPWNGHDIYFLTTNRGWRKWHKKNASQPLDSWWVHLRWKRGINFRRLGIRSLQWRLGRKRLKYFPSKQPNKSTNSTLYSWCASFGFLTGSLTPYDNRALKEKKN